MNPRRPAVTRPAVVLIPAFLVLAAVAMTMTAGGTLPTGSCCIPLVGCLDDLPEIECVDLGGVYSGDGSSCPAFSGVDCDANGEDDMIDLYCGTSVDQNGNNVPDQCEQGGCCFPLVGCEEGVFEIDCVDAGGTYSGDGSSCPSFSGEDCNANGMDDTIDLCSGSSSDLDGNNVPDECELDGACCIEEGKCVDGTAADCNAVGGTFEGGVPCPDANCGSCAGDIDGDGMVGILDFLMLLGAWGPNPGHPADLDGDDVVGIADFLMLLAAWGPCV